MKDESHIREICRGLREGIGMKTYLHGPMDYAKKLKTTITCRGPGSTRKKKRYTSSREQEDMDAHMRPCGTTLESRTHTV